MAVRQVACRAIHPRGQILYASLCDCTYLVKEMQSENWMSLVGRRPPVVAGGVLTYGSTAGELATQGTIFGFEDWQEALGIQHIKDDPESWPGR